MRKTSIFTCGPEPATTIVSSDMTPVSYKSIEIWAILHVCDFFEGDGSRDNIPADVLKSGKEITVNNLQKLCIEVWGKKQ